MLRTGLRLSRVTDISGRIVNAREILGYGEQMYPGEPKRMAGHAAITRSVEASVYTLTLLLD